VLTIMANVPCAAAETYMRFGIPIIPLGQDKNPLIGGFKVNKLSVRQSRAYMARFPHSEAFGVPDGRLSGLVRLDVDEPGDAIVAEVIRRAGDTPAKVRTASGKTHLLYRFNGERRLTARPVAEKRPPSNLQPWADLCVDLCGQGGYSVSPPSRCNGGTYELLGDLSLEDLLIRRHLLPTVQGLDSRAYLPAQPSSPEFDRGQDETDLREVRPGNRDAVFYRKVARICQQVHRAGGAKDDAMNKTKALNSEFPVPLGNDEVERKVNHWWQRTINGENCFGTGHRTPARDWVQDLAATDPSLLALLVWLKKMNGPESEFWIANGMAGDHLTGWWSIDRLRDTRQRAMDGKWIERTAKAVTGQNAVYRWGPTAMANIFT
jgi:bifunctional DNA primase/polymerase-like protein